MDLREAERLLSNLPPDHPLAPAVRALIEDRDAARRLVAEVERLRLRVEHFGGGRK